MTERSTRAEIARSMQLTLRRASASRTSGHWDDDDFDVFDGEQDVGQIYRVNGPDEIWFWGVDFAITNRKSHGRANSLDEAKAAFRAVYEAWQRERGR
jgi:hypothetical protein